MKKMNLLIAALSVTAAFTSCSKKDNTIDPVVQPPVKANERLLLSATDPYQAFIFEYNADKTMKARTWGNGTYKETFTYLPGQMTVTQFSGNKKSGETVFELSNGIAQKATATYYDANGAITDQYTTTYSYNPQGKLIKHEYTKNGMPDGTYTISYDANGDESATETKDKNGVITRQTELEYDLTLADKSVSFGQFNYAATGSVFPKMANHLIKKLTVKENNTTVHYNYSHTVDANGYELSGIIKDDMNVKISDWTYTWQ